jgi:ADP-ribose pyrophosphatase YjhB (NUDIX family)
MTAIFDHDRLLLTQRGDLGVWALPGGRLDEGEHLAETAEREAREETGLRVAVQDAIGLYYLDGWRRLNVVFRAVLVGGTLKATTDETRAARWFSRIELPPMPLKIIADDAFGSQPQMRTLTFTKRERQQIKRRLALRYISNLVRGRPEPRFPIFGVRAVLVVSQRDSGRIFTVQRAVMAINGQSWIYRALPNISLDGETAPWEQAAALLAGFKLTAELRWCGLIEYPAHNLVEFVFSGQTDPDAGVGGSECFRGGEWSNPLTTALEADDSAILERVRSASSSTVWRWTPPEPVLEPGAIVHTPSDAATKGQSH